MKELTPRTLGYRMPAEWELQDAIWLTWPHNPITWPNELLNEVQSSYIQIIRALSTHQRVRLLVEDSASAMETRARLAGAGIPLTQVEFIEMHTEDSWI